MAGRGRLPGPLIPRFPAASFRLMTTPTYKVTPPWMPGSPPTPGPPPSQSNLVPRTGWRFNPLDPATPACKAVQDTLDRELELFPPGSCQDAAAAARKEGAERPTRMGQTPTGSAGGLPGCARHWRFPHSKSYGPVMEHALAGSVGHERAIHPKGESGLEFQVALAFLYDFSYQNDQGAESGGLPGSLHVPSAQEPPTRHPVELSLALFREGKGIGKDKGVYPRLLFPGPDRGGSQLGL